MKDQEHHVDHHHDGEEHHDGHHHHHHLTKKEKDHKKAMAALERVELMEMTENKTHDADWKADIDLSLLTHRELYGTWRRTHDFTLTVIGYTINVHNFWRFPFLCYKFGGIFFVPFFIMLIIFGAPILFMEFTIGQFRSVGASDAFGLMAPIMAGVGYIVTWNAMVSSWMYVQIVNWARVYSRDATSCYRGWETCKNSVLYNTMECYTGRLDKKCDKVYGENNGSLKTFPRAIYYNYSCVTIEEYCKLNDLKYLKSRNKPWCHTIENKTVKGVSKKVRKRHSIYKKRVHAAAQFF